MRQLRYIEKCTGADHDGPAWIAYVLTSRSGRTIYFDGRALRAARGVGGSASHFDLETGEAYWVSGVKQDGSNRHRAGAGKILVERSAVPELLAHTDRAQLDDSLYQVIADLPPTDPQLFVEKFNEPM